MVERVKRVAWATGAGAHRRQRRPPGLLLGQGLVLVLARAVGLVLVLAPGA
ncbi:hypothetical protein [Streptomyces sp. S4.7]|uniref:hypothetical protein n=1 Tax=Streptomyces sp. S4.7 TaxID=2705439 RepID=UPI0013DC658C|nr:hypothetical protein [Streptomyces sp. S4.7]